MRLVFELFVFLWMRALGGVTLVKICDLGNCCVRPKVVNVVVFAHVGNEDVYHDVSVIHGYPNGVFAAGNGGRTLVTLFTGYIFDAVNYCVNLRRGVCRADDKSFGGC